MENKHLQTLFIVQYVVMFIMLIAFALAGFKSAMREDSTPQTTPAAVATAEADKAVTSGH
jgi:uncharacterized protein YpmB